MTSSDTLRTRPARRIALVGAGGLLAVTLAACGSSAPTATAVPAAAGAVPAAVTTASPSASSAAGASDPRALAMRIGVAASAARYVQVDGNLGAKAVSGSASLVGGVVHSDVTVGKTHVITIGKTAYVKTGSGAWAIRRAGGMPASPMNPQALFTKLGPTVTDLGSTTLGNATVTHYRSTMSMAQAQAAADTAHARTALAKLAANGVTGYVADLYVGAGDLPVKATLTVEGVSGAAASSALTFSHWGDAVTITAP